MDLGNTQEGDVSIIVLNEERLDASTAPEFKKQMEQLIDESNKQVILDISKLGFMDSSSLGALVGVLKYLGSDGKMVVVGASGIVLDLFKLTRMDKIFTLAGDTETAKGLFMATA